MACRNTKGEVSHRALGCYVDAMEWNLRSAKKNHRLILPRSAMSKIKLAVEIPWYLAEESRRLRETVVRGIGIIGREASSLQEKGHVYKVAAAVLQLCYCMPYLKW